MRVSANTVVLVAVATIRSKEVSAFAPSTVLPAKQSLLSTSTSTSRNMVPPGTEHVLSSFDADALQSSVQSAHDFLHASSVLLSDAAAATVDAAADAAAEDDGGWWQTYLNFMENSLIGVHSTIDQPLRDMGITQTWGPSIFLFTAGVRTALVPLSIQQSKSTEYTKALKPYQDEIKEKFKDNKDMMNRATAKLFEDAGTNPLSGCLVSIVQLPIFLGLYRGVTLLAKDGNLQEPFLFIPSLEGPVTGPTFRGMEWLTEGWTFPEGGIPVPSLGWETTLAFLIMPCLLVLGQKVSMSALSPPVDTSNMTEEEKSQNDTSQQVLKFLPLLIGFFSLQVPAGLTIYWFTSNLCTLLQSLAVKAYFAANPPNIELPDYWDALDSIDEMSPEDKRKAAEAGLAAGPKFEDLIDESKFHYVVERNPVRENSAAWDRIKDQKVEIPSQMLSWVQADGGVPALHDVHSAEIVTDAHSSAATNVTDLGVEKETAAI